MDILLPFQYLNIVKTTHSKLNQAILNYHDRNPQSATLTFYEQNLVCYKL